MFLSIAFFRAILLDLWANFKSQSLSPSRAVSYTQCLIGAVSESQASRQDKHPSSMQDQAGSRSAWNCSFKEHLPIFLCIISPQSTSFVTSWVHCPNRLLNWWKPVREFFLELCISSRLASPPPFPLMWRRPPSSLPLKLLAYSTLLLLTSVSLSLSLSSFRSHIFQLKYPDSKAVLSDCKLPSPHCDTYCWHLQGRWLLGSMFSKRLLFRLSAIELSRLGSPRAFDHWKLNTQPCSSHATSQQRNSQLWPSFILTHSVENTDCSLYTGFCLKCWGCTGWGEHEGLSFYWFKNH